MTNYASGNICIMQKQIYNGLLLSTLLADEAAKSCERWTIEDAASPDDRRPDSSIPVRGEEAKDCQHEVNV